ncbi:MBL fold metallo-hydrolase [Niabella hibiscisoli]|uniref:hypothetical protein n=1 Tax=Niabella hibiscisoli TaxID=1825928 RepID=UPI001F0D797F|nr:hypothetical protein [Niabella hibiscisoli]MCH5719667.1 hypothetical protein [Niabella hibiscisoli]
MLCQQIIADCTSCIIGGPCLFASLVYQKKHRNPYHALQVFKDTRAKVVVPFHYGTFDVGDEPIGETGQILNKLNAERKITGELKILKIGDFFSV